jgi:hypothetical protein
MQEKAWPLLGRTPESTCWVHRYFDPPPGSSDVEAEEGKVSFVAQKSILAVLT